MLGTIVNEFRPVASEYTPFIAYPSQESIGSTPPSLTYSEGSVADTTSIESSTHSTRSSSPSGWSSGAQKSSLAPGEGEVDAVDVHSVDLLSDLPGGTDEFAGIGAHIEGSSVGVGAWSDRVF